MRNLSSNSGHGRGRAPKKTTSALVNSPVSIFTRRHFLLLFSSGDHPAREDARLLAAAHVSQQSFVFVVSDCSPKFPREQKNNAALFHFVSCFLRSPCNQFPFLLDPASHVCGFGLILCLTVASSLCLCAKEQFVLPIQSILKAERRKGRLITEGRKKRSSSLC